MKDYEEQLIEGLTEDEAKRLIASINAINKLVGLEKFGSI